MSPELIHRAMVRSAERSPEAPAFHIPGGSLDYATLASRASRLAGVLREIGVVRGDRIGIYVDKSLESAVALFGVMQAGAAYVPLDPAAPAARTGTVLKQCGARVLITHPARRRSVPGVLAEADVDAVIGLDAPADGTPAPTLVSWADVLQGPEAPVLAAGASELDLAYVIFTSGSTGTPKGIMHTHQSGMAYARMAAELYGLRPQDRLGNLSPLHFDMSTFDYFCGPLAGACTVVVPEGYTKLPASLSELAEEARLTIWYSVPFALTQMLLHGAMEERDLSAIRWVLFGGEPFVPKHLAALTRLLPGARFSNVYGPAEVNQCTYHHLDGPWDEADGQPPIGQACPNADLAVVDETDRPVSAGTAGELIVRAPTMMRGYWQRPELNGRVFLERPGSGGVADRWLRTGDIAVEGADGALRFVGRKDRQIKTRGYRVDLDEVEATLAAHADVEEAAAFAVSGGEGLTLIEAAVTPRRGRALGDAEIAAFAAERLPGYARPVRIAIRTEFPRTTSGKIDRRRLGLEAAEWRATG